MNYRRNVPLLSIAASVALAADAQSVGCPIDGYRCLEAAHIQACREPSSTRTSCAAWLTTLQAHPNAGEITWQLMEAITHMTLADLTVESPGDSRRYKEASRSIYMEIVDRDPANVQALLGLSASSDDAQERARYLEQAVEAEPGNLFAVQGLATNLATAGNVLRAAQLLEQAYGASADGRRWQLAARAVTFYRQSRRTDLAEAMRERVRDDVDADSFIEQLTAQETAVERASEVAGTLCHPPIVEIIGSSDCVKAIDAIVERIGREDSTTRRQILADSAADAMVSVGRTASLASEEPRWQSRFSTAIQQLLSQGLRSSTLYDAYASFVTEPAAHLDALQSAAALAPNDGQALYRLGLGYFEQERWANAIEQFAAARPLLPDWRHEAVDQHIRQAEQRLRSTEP